MRHARKDALSRIYGVPEMQKALPSLPRFASLERWSPEVDTNSAFADKAGGLRSHMRLHPLSKSFSSGSELLIWLSQSLASILARALSRNTKSPLELMRTAACPVRWAAEVDPNSALAYEAWPACERDGQGGRELRL